MTIGDRIKQKREERSKTQEELAKEIHSTKQTIYKYENNIVTNIPSDKIEVMARFLKTTPSYLMGWEDAKNDIAVKGLIAKIQKENYTDDEIREIEQFADFVKNKRFKDGGK